MSLTKIDMNTDGIYWGIVTREKGRHSAALQRTFSANQILCHARAGVGAAERCARDTMQSTSFRLPQPRGDYQTRPMNTPDKKSTNNAAEFAWEDDDVFGRIATRYDMLCDIFSLGIHRLWKRRVAKRIASEDWNVLLDSASGTGDIMLRLIAEAPLRGRTLIASDISARMLSIAEKRLSAWQSTVSLRLLDAERMPSIQSSSVDAYSISLGFKICNRHLVAGEALRVLKPGGRLIILEASNIRWPVLHRLYLAYMALCMPALGWLATGGDASAYKYLLQGIRDFPTAEALARELEECGFEDVVFERLSLGIVAIHTARKPREATAS
jgi:demethylmenaquinone methyltransferase / 2-methoxy-6-polyprenyl-1,4-benzoquinol methylase